MLCEHLGEIVDIQDPVNASYENAVIDYLRRHSSCRQNDLYIRTAGRRLGHQQFLEIIEKLVQRGIVRRQTTNRKDSFVLRLANSDLQRNTSTK